MADTDTTLLDVVNQTRRTTCAFCENDPRFGMCLDMGCSHLRVVALTSENTGLRVAFAESKSDPGYTGWLYLDHDQTRSLIAQLQRTLPETGGDK